MKTGDSKGKIFALESLRGLAALTVVFHHFVGSFYPAIIHDKQPSHSGYEWVLAQTPLNFFINGQFAVVIFFVLSGFVLSHGYFKRYGDLVAATVKRYFRLAPVVIISVIAAYLLLKWGLFYNHAAAGIAQSEYLSTFWAKDTNPLFAVFEAFIGVFTIPPNWESLNPVLWTLYYELGGSFIVFALLAFLGKDKRRWYVYPLLVVAFLDTWYVGFIVGMVLSDIYSNRQQFVERLQKLSTVYKVGLLLTAIYFGAVPLTRTPETVGFIFKPLIFTSDYNFNVGLLYLIAAVILVVLALSTRRINKVLELKPLVHLGSLSYSLYATHLLVLGSITSLIFIKCVRYFSYNMSVAITFVLYLLIVVAVAEVVRRYVDKPSIHMSQRIGQMVEEHGK